MRRRPARRRLDTVIVLGVVVPFMALVLQALADTWHGRSVLPQQVGTRGLRTVVDDPIVMEAVIGSFAVAAGVAIVAVAFAWPAARYLAATRSFAGWALLAAPILLPPLVLGDGLAPWLLELGLGGRIAISVAHLPIAIPYATIALASGFGPALEELDHSAAVLGARPWQRLVHIIAPAMRRHAALALALAFTVSWSQYAISLTVGGGTPMLPLVLVPYVRSDPQVAATLSLLFLAAPVLALAAASRAGEPGSIQRLDASNTTWPNTPPCCDVSIAQPGS
jgi:putative spermidine/putrescine transport system permease protein